MPIHSIPDLPRMLCKALEHAETALCIHDDSRRLLYCNPAFGRLLGHAPETLVGRAFDELAGAPRPAQPAANGRLETLVRCRDGRRIWCGIASTGLDSAPGEPGLRLLALTEITQSKIHEVLLDRLLEGMARDEAPERLMEAACLEIERLLPRVSASVLRINAGRLYPLAGPSLPPAYLQALDGLPLGDGPGSEEAWAGDIEQHPLWSAYRHLLPPELRSCSVTPIRSSGGQLIGCFVCYGQGAQLPCATQQCLLDICTHLCALVLERDQARARIHQLAYYDDLTGLPNRHLLQVLAGTELAGRQGLAVLYIGLDRFRQINDSFGRPSGDELLRTIARRLRQACRSEDHVGRQANDEFVVLLPACDRAAASRHIARLKAALDAPWRVAGAPHNPSASIGVSLFPEDGEDFQTLLRHAAMAMNQAKGKGKGRGGHVFFSEELERLAQERVALESALREALARQRLHLNYQPLVDIREGRLRGVEVLARWHHPQLGNISPERFIPLSEECGLSIELGRWVLREACRQLAAWRRAGLRVPEISVNLSAGDFQDPQLPAAVLRTLEEHGLHGADLTLEITESALMEADSDTLGVLDQLHELGIRLALDDFGTGYSSLARLNRLPVQELKLDRSFVRDLESNSTSRTLSDAVLHIGRSLGMTVVAEGIENPEQLRILEAQGYTLAQGYLLSPPLPAEGLAAWLKARESP
ncbi:bifunctional diguanylate cyclase/phosphodiesterase [Pseudomonas sp. RW407]|uniref:sensor domain-containing protein n=2 Tax=unclassified Pseudomonas TaxID=196821 RepID=UPI000D6EECC1|nr:EAL domain-containing protein [Pseudomonas sp. RW407]PWU30516.1 bifunctional diguanylate cyclase/phosphodiesterase [Pseudomonas sp. RW407]